MSLWRSSLIASFGGSTPPTPVAYTSWEVTVPSGGGTYGIFVIGTVDWGDGSATTTSSDRNTQTTHIYSEGTYTVTLTGTNHRLSHYNGSVGTNVNWVTRCFTLGTDMDTNAAYIFAACQYLTDVLCGFPDTIVNMNFAFQNCSRLANITSPALPSGIAYASQSASGNRGLYNGFQGCPTLAVDVAQFFTNVTTSSFVRLDGAFSGCSSLYGTAPADKLWNNATMIVHGGCFTNCTGLTNYADIPADWK